MIAAIRLLDVTLSSLRSMDFHEAVALAHSSPGILTGPAQTPGD